MEYTKVYVINPATRDLLVLQKMVSMIVCYQLIITLRCSVLVWTLTLKGTELLDYFTKL